MTCEARLRDASFRLAGCVCRSLRCFARSGGFATTPETFLITEFSAPRRDGHSEWRNHVRAQRDACREERRRIKRDKDDYREVRQFKRG